MSNYTANEVSGDAIPDMQSFPTSSSHAAGVSESAGASPLEAFATAKLVDSVSSLFFHYSFEDIEPKFYDCHKKEVNVVLHMMTTPLGLIGALSLIRALTHSSSTMATCIAFYLLTLLPALPVGVYMVNFLLCLVLVAATRYLKLSVKSSVALIVVAYVLQDLAHLGTNEPTYQSQYSKNQSSENALGIDGHVRTFSCPPNDDKHTQTSHLDNFAVTSPFPTSSSSLSSVSLELQVAAGVCDPNILSAPIVY